MGEIAAKLLRHENIFNFHQQVHFNQIKSKMAANNMSNAYLQMFFQLYYYCSRVTYTNYNKISCLISLEAVVQRCSVKNLLLKLRAEFTEKRLCRSLF